MENLQERLIEWLLGDVASMKAHPIKTIFKILLIALVIAIILIAMAYLTAWGNGLYNSNHSALPGETQMNFYAPVTITPGATSSTQPTITLQTSSDTKSGLTDVYRPSIIDGKTMPPLLSAESIEFANQKMVDGYHNEIVMILGIPVGNGAPIINGITPPSIIENCKSLGESQPGIALNGSMQYRIIYFFPFDCVSREPVATGTSLSFGLNYSWSSMSVSTSSSQNVCQY